VKHIHGMGCGPNLDTLRFSEGRYVLVPYKTKGIASIVADSCRGMFLDNSAFTYWSKGGELPFDDVVSWYEDWAGHPRLDAVFIPDVIDGDEKVNDDMIRRFMNSVSTRISRVSVPVWHLHETLNRLERLTNEWSMVALGSSGEYKTPGSSLWRRRMESVMSVACDGAGRPKTRLHGLRMLAPKVVSDYPFYSADSTNASVNSGAVKRFGMYPAASRFVRAQAIADRIERAVSPGCWDGEVQAEFNFGE